MSSGGDLVAPPDPLILTLAMDELSFGRLNEMRQRHFPPALNRVPAHVTLFHHLPGESAEAIARELDRTCRDQPCISLRVTGVRFLGRGVAYTLDSPELASLRGLLAQAWQARLTPQDRQHFRPHVTLQNKVPNEEARALHSTLAATFIPFEITGTGLLLWRYRGGPWELAGRFDFR